MTDDLDPFSFFRRPETDPTPRALATGDPCPRDFTLELNGAPARLLGGVVLARNAQAKAAYTKTISNPTPESWTSEMFDHEPPRTMEDIMSIPPAWEVPTGGEHHRRAMGFRFEWNNCPSLSHVDSIDEAKRCKVYRSSPENGTLSTILGTLPRAGLNPRCSAIMLEEGMSPAEARMIRPYMPGDTLGPPKRRFVLVWERIWSDDGWDGESVLVADGVELELLQRTPGWQSSSN